MSLRPNSLSDLQGPVEIYVGNVHSSISRKRIVEFLMENAERNKVVDFNVDEIVPVPVVAATEAVTAAAASTEAPAATAHSHSGGQMEHSDW